MIIYIKGDGTNLILSCHVITEFLKKYNIPVHYNFRVHPVAGDYIVFHLPEVLSVLRELRLLSHQHHFDFFLKPSYFPEKGLVAFDMDSTFIEQEVVDEIAAETGLTDKIRFITESAMEGNIDFCESFSRRIRLLRGTPLTIMETVYSRLRVSRRIPELLSLLKGKGFRIALISGGLTFFTERFREKYGLDYVLANNIESAAGVLTGKVILPIVNAVAKVSFLNQLSTEEHIDMANIIAVGDGANDIPMLRTAGTGVAYRGKSIVRDNIENQINYSDIGALSFFIDESLSGQDEL
ncbi:phosphoserine phosphatase SerB [Salmonella enterica]